jgi:DNA end-binding protein Ku
MQTEKAVGLAHVVISNREQLVVLRPVGRLLTISMLHYDAAVRQAAAFDEELEDVPVTAQEAKLAKTLIDVSVTKHAELEEYRNLYNERMEALVQAKIEGKEIATVASKESGPPTINIMDALKASLESKRPRSPGSKKLGTRHRAKAPAKRKKTG